MKTPEDAFKRILEVLDLHEIPYMVGWSLASSLYGIRRASMAVDLVATLRADQVDQFAAALKGDFYDDAEIMQQALEYGRSFNIIHYASSLKFAIFSLRKNENSQAQFQRRRFAETRASGDEPIECSFASAEDTLLCHRAGCE